MCGLAGIFSTQPIPDIQAVIGRMNQTLNHRGPDQDGIFVHPTGRAALGHKRLSIVDLTHGRQPMTDVDGLFTLVFNGEIYNNAELKAELVAKGQPIRTRSDTETLLYAYREWGPDCLTRLRGMFCFAVFDHRKNEIFIARDRLGIKPLYYAFHAGAFLFASECKAILEFPGFPRELDPQALSDYFTFNYVPAPKSIFAGIRKLAAGHCLTVGDGGAPRIRKYWDLEFPESGDGDFRQATEDLLECLDGAVKSHMDSDVPLGAFLSGGLDSAAVVGLMARHSDKPILTNTIGFDQEAFDETAEAAETAAFFKADHREFRVKADAMATLKKLAWYFDEPFADPSMLPTYLVCAMARERVVVALSGDGGDENFAGYRRYYYDRLENRVRGRIPAFIRGPLFGALGGLYPKGDWMPQPLRAKTLLRNLSYPPTKGYFTSMSQIGPELKQRVFSGDLRRRLEGYDSLSVFEDHLRDCPIRDPLSRIQYLDFKTYLADGILTKVDRASMAVSLEVRVPILDHLVVERAARMPSDWKLHGRESKYVFKQAVSGLVPKSIFTRRKSGFSIPARRWFQKDLRGFTEDALFGPEGLKDSGLFEMKVLERMHREHVQGVRDHNRALFAFLSFSLWRQQFKAA